MFGSVTGTAPGIPFPGGVLLPLNFDPYMLLLINGSGAGLIGPWLGLFDATGAAQSGFFLPETPREWLQNFALVLRVDSGGGDPGIVLVPAARRSAHVRARAARRLGAGSPCLTNGASSGPRDPPTTTSPSKSRSRSEEFHPRARVERDNASMNGSPPWRVGS